MASPASRLKATHRDQRRLVVDDMFDQRASGPRRRREVVWAVFRLDPLSCHRVRLILHHGACPQRPLPLRQLAASVVNTRLTIAALFPLTSRPRAGRRRPFRGAGGLGEAGPSARQPPAPAWRDRRSPLRPPLVRQRRGPHSSARRIGFGEPTSRVGSHLRPASAASQTRCETGAMMTTPTDGEWMSAKEAMEYLLSRGMSHYEAKRTIFDRAHRGIGWGTRQAGYCWERAV